MQRDIRVREVTLRDGLPIHPAFLPTPDKLACIATEGAAERRASPPGAGTA